ncbi:MAG: 16S rRNA (adenine(1518)-N(6)/adenine(1519)-N(6))-dimethyltransferase RsmA [Candidatus Dasytiphilus stammeri]
MCTSKYLSTARKRWGQYFLQDNIIINNIICAIAPHFNQALVEIGPGRGSLTNPISQYVEELTVIEIDKNLSFLLQNQDSLRNKLTIYCQDVLTFNFYELAQKKGQLLRVFGNIAYNISTPLLFKLFQFINIIKDMHLMLQKEVVNRIVAGPGSKDYGRLSVMSQYYCQADSLMEITPQSFIPRPKVHSALLRLVPHKIMPHGVKNVQSLSLITKRAFSQRRKILRNSLKDLVPMDILHKLDIDSQWRAENVSVALYCRLANWLTYNNFKKILENNNTSFLYETK